MLEGNFIAADSTSKRYSDDKLDLIGIAIQFDNYDIFKKHYIKTKKDICKEYSLDIPYHVIKFQDLQKRAPSYNLSEILGHLVKELLKNSSIKEIHACKTFWTEKFTSPRKDKKEFSGIDFADKILSQYYTLVVTWRMYKTEDRTTMYPYHPKKVLIDDFTGDLTECWKFVGKQYELSIVPHGDITYPPISLCDLLASCIRIEGIIDKKEIYNFLKENSFKDTYVTSEFVGCDNPDAKAIIPKLPYPMRTENHYPHPIIFIYKGKLDKQYQHRIENSVFFRKVLEYAENLRGCATFFDEELHTKILKSNDLFICIDDKSKEDIEEILFLNGKSDIGILSTEEFLRKEDFL